MQDTSLELYDMSKNTTSNTYRIGANAEELVSIDETVDTVNSSLNSYLDDVSYLKIIHNPLFFM